MAELEREQFLYLTTTGWKSGRSHEIEIWFTAHAGRLYVIAETGRRAHWVQNLLRNPQVSIRVAGQHFSGQARVLDPVREPELFASVQALSDAKYGWSAGLLVELNPQT